MKGILAKLWILWFAYEQPEVSDVNGKSFRAGTRAFMNGRDISHRCYRAEVYGGALIKAYLFKHRNGKPYPEGNNVAREVRWGFGFLEYPA